MHGTPELRQNGAKSKSTYINKDMGRIHKYDPDIIRMQEMTGWDRGKCVAVKRYWSRQSVCLWTVVDEMIASNGKRLPRNRFSKALLYKKTDSGWTTASQEETSIYVKTRILDEAIDK